MVHSVRSMAAGAPKDWRLPPAQCHHLALCPSAGWSAGIVVSGSGWGSDQVLSNGSVVYTSVALQRYPHDLRNHQVWLSQSCWKWLRMTILLAKDDWDDQTNRLNTVDRMTDEDFCFCCGHWLDGAMDVFWASDGLRMHSSAYLLSATGC